MKPLNERQEKFVKSLLSGKTKRQAYLDAYPKSQHWKPAAVSNAALRLENNPNVKARIDELKQAASHNAKTSLDTFVKEIEHLAFANIDPDDLKPRDKIRALELLGKTLGFAHSENTTADIETLDPIIDQLKAYHDRNH